MNIDLAEVRRLADILDERWPHLHRGAPAVLRALADELERLRAKPAGWKLVPRQPTEEMMNAGLYQSSADTKFEDLLSAWFDMFDAAPAQQEPTHD